MVEKHEEFAQAEFAQAADLLAPAEGTKEVYLKTLKKKVVIKKINTGDLAAILKVAKDNEIKQFTLICWKGLSKPKISLQQAENLALKVTIELAAEISKFSELDKESLTRTRNLLETGI